MTENLIAKYAAEIAHARAAAAKAVHLAPKPSRRARAMSSAADPILAMASAPHTAVQPRTGGLKFKARK